MADNVKTGIRLEAEGEKEFVESLENATGSIDDFSKAAENATGKTSALDDALKDLASQQETEKLKENITEVGAEIVTGVANMANSAIKGGEAFLSAVGDTAEYADEIGKAAERIGFSTDAYQEWDYVLKQSGSSMKASSTAFTTLAKAQQGATKTAGEDFARIGLSLQEIQDLSPEELFEAVITQLQKMDSGSERTYAATKLLGSGFAQQLGPVLNMTADDTENLRQQIHDLGGVLSSDQIANSAAYNDSLDNLHIKFNSLKNQILLGAIPALTNFQEDLLENGSVEKFGDLVGFATEKVADFAGFLAEHSDAVIGTVEAVGGAFATWKAASVVTQIVGDAQKLYSWLSLVGTALGVSGGTVAAGVGLTVVGAMETAQRAADVFGGVVGTLGDGHELRAYADNVTYLEERVNSLIAVSEDPSLSGFWDFMQQDELDMAIISLQNARTEYEAVAAAKQAAEQTGIDPAETMTNSAAAAEVASGAVADVSTATAEASETVAAGTTQMLQTVEASAGQIRTEFVAGVDEMSSTAADSILNTQDVMAQNMEILASNANVWGEDMMISLANGIIQGGNSWVLPAIDQVAQGIEARIGFSEPDVGPLSKFHTFAPDMMALFAQGIRDGESLLAGAISDVFDLGPLLSGGQQQTGQHFNYGGVNVVIYQAEGQSADELYEVFSQRLAHDVTDREEVFST